MVREIRHQLRSPNLALEQCGRVSKLAQALTTIQKIKKRTSFQINLLDCQTICYDGSSYLTSYTNKIIKIMKLINKKGLKALPFLPS